MKKLIAFVGFPSSGKNTAAQALMEHGYLPFSFADALKDMLSAIFCWDRQLLEGITLESREFREKVDRWWAERLGIPEFTPRWAMRNIGNLMRRQFHIDIWVYNVEQRLILIEAPVILIDARFPNEIAMIRRHHGHVERIKRGDDPCIQELHESEKSWLECAIDGTTENDGSIEDLHTKIIQKFC